MACAFSDSARGMSDEVRTMYCEDCDKELGTCVTATGFCIDCVEYLCPTCIRYHQKLLPQHTLQDSANMPQDFCFDKCPKHPQEIIKFYCNACDLTACPKCKTEKHDNCSKVCHIPEMVQSENISTEVEQLTLSIDATLEELSAKKDQAAYNLREVNSIKEKAIAAIGQQKATLKKQVQDQQKYLLDDLQAKQEQEIYEHEKKRAEIIAQLDKEEAELKTRQYVERSQREQKLSSYQTKLLKKIDKTGQDLKEKSEQMNKTDVDKLQLVLIKTDKAETEVRVMKNFIERKKETDGKCGLFVVTKRAKSKMKKIQTDIQKTKNIEIHNYEFKTQEEKINLNSTECEIKIGCFLDKSEVKRTLTLETNIQIRKTEGRATITGLCKVSDQLVVADHTNASIKLFDLNQNCLTSTFKLERGPFDATCVDTKKVAITLPEARKIKILTVRQKDEFSLVNDIYMGQKCYGIDYLNPNLITTCQDPGCVKIVSLRGYPVQTLCGFHAPLHICVHQNSEMLYIEDIKDETASLFEKYIKKASCDGRIITAGSSSYKQSALAVDHLGSVYVSNNVCSASLWSMRNLSSKKNRTYQAYIKQLSANLEEVHEIQVDQYSPWHSTVTCLFYCNQENKLYVGTDRGIISVYEVHQ